MPTLPGEGDAAVTGTATAVQESPRPHGRGWGLVWALFAASGALYFLSGNEADNDLWVHLKIGLDILRHGAVPHFDTYSYTASGTVWIDHEWLTHVLFGVVYRAGGDAALLGLKLAIAAITAAVLARSVTRRASSPHVRGVVLVLAFAVLARGFAIRPQILSYALVALMLCWLDAVQRPGISTAAGLFALIILWANVHGGVLLGVGIAGLYALWLVASDLSAAVRTGIATALAAAAALFANPYGPSLGAYLVHELSTPHPITEWQPLAFEPAQATFLALAALFVVALPFMREWRRRGWEVALSALLLWMAFHQRRHTPLFAIAAAPVIAAGLQRGLEILPWPQRWRLSAAAQRMIGGAIVALAVLQLTATAARLAADRFEIVYRASDYPVGAVRYIESSGVRANLALPLEWGGYALWHLAPKVKVSLDGRFATVYPPKVVAANFAFFAGGNGWSQLIDHYPTNLVLAPVGDQLLIRTSPEWRPVYVDSVAIVYARRDSPEVRALPPLTRGATPAGPLVFP